jgi:hypothetical protein
MFRRPALFQLYGATSVEINFKTSQAGLIIGRAARGAQSNPSRLRVCRISHRNDGTVDPVTITTTYRTGLIASGLASSDRDALHTAQDASHDSRGCSKGSLHVARSWTKCARPQPMSQNSNQLPATRLPSFLNWWTVATGGRYHRQFSQSSYFDTSMPSLARISSKTRLIAWMISLS